MPQASTETTLVSAEQSGQRLDRVLAAGSALSRTRLKALILAGAVTTGSRTIRDPGYRVNAGESVAVTVPEAEPLRMLCTMVDLWFTYVRGAVKPTRPTVPNVLRTLP